MSGWRGAPRPLAAGIASDRESAQAADARPFALHERHNEAAAIGRGLGRLLLAGLLAFLPVAVHAAEETDAAIAALRSGGHVLVLRHAATVPGIGDPPGYRVDDCATQRNLSEDGRRDARALGARLAAARVAFDQVLSSRWCRGLDTARLAFGRVEAWAALDSFFDDRAREPAQTAEVRARVAAWRGSGTLVLVTHMVNIAALVGEGVAMGEAVVLRPAPGTPRGFERVGRLGR